MKRYVSIVLLAAIALCIAPPSHAQLIVGGNQVQITEGGNAANVTSGNALQTDLHSVGGTTISLVSSGIPVYIEGAGIAFGGTSLADEGGFTAGTTAGTLAQGFYQTTPTSNALTNGQAGAIQLTSNRAAFINQYQYAGTVLGAPSNYGTFPGTVEVAGVNAYITNTVPVSFSGQTVGLVAGTALVGKTVPLTACGTTNYDAAFQALPTSNTALTATTTCVQNMVFCNTSTSTAYSVNVSDDQGSPVSAIASTSIPPSSCANYAFNWTEFTSGIKWYASNAAITGAVHGLQ